MVMPDANNDTDNVSDDGREEGSELFLLKRFS